jgi:hypothetical protein
MIHEYWLSWADANGFNGACVVDAEDFLSAVATANQLGIRPSKGGQIMGYPIISGGVIPKNKLLVEEEASLYGSRLGDE